jgi:hypothetical protein
MPGEYGCRGDSPRGVPGKFVDEIDGCFESSLYGAFGRSGCESTALVAMDVRGACRLWLMGIC